MVCNGKEADPTKNDCKKNIPKSSKVFEKIWGLEMNESIKQFSKKFKPLKTFLAIFTAKWSNGTLAISQNKI